MKCIPYKRMKNYEFNRMQFYENEQFQFVKVVLNKISNFRSPLNFSRAVCSNTEATRPATACCPRVWTLGKSSRWAIRCHSTAKTTTRSTCSATAASALTPVRGPTAPMCFRAIWRLLRRFGIETICAMGDRCFIAKSLVSCSSFFFKKGRS